MTNVMPLVWQARRTRRNREDGNPFATEETIHDLIDRLEAAHLAGGNDRVSRLLHVEIDLLGDLTCPAS